MFKKKPSLWHVHAVHAVHAAGILRTTKKNEVLLLAKNENNTDVIV